MVNMKEQLLFRFHKGGLAESMETVIPINCLADIAVALKEKGWPEGEIKVEYYCVDNRIGWTTYVVTLDGDAVGFTNGKVENMNAPVATPLFDGGLEVEAEKARIEAIAKEATRALFNKYQIGQFVPAGQYDDEQSAYFDDAAEKEFAQLLLPFIKKASGMTNANASS